MAEPLLRDQRILVVEDDYLIARAVEHSLQRAGAIVLGPVPSVEGALALLNSGEKVDAAVLDIKLGKQKVYPVADALMLQGIHYVFATGNDAADVPPEYLEVVRCEKPINPADLVDALMTRKELNVLTQDHQIRDYILSQLAVLIALADESGNALLAAKISEAIDVMN